MKVKRTKHGFSFKFDRPGEGQSFLRHLDPDRPLIETVAAVNAEMRAERKRSAK